MFSAFLKSFSELLERNVVPIKIFPLLEYDTSFHIHFDICTRSIIGKVNVEILRIIKYLLCLSLCNGFIDLVCIEFCQSLLRNILPW